MSGTFKSVVPWELVSQLFEALEAAESHLDYCGYGDAWERECAKQEKLQEKVEAALAAVRPYVEEPLPGERRKRNKRSMFDAK